jgi:hypothetical protein
MYEAGKETVKAVRRDQGTGDSGYQYMRSLHRFFEWLARSDRIEYDPMDGIEEEFRWNLTSDTGCLDEEQLRKLWQILTKSISSSLDIVSGVCERRNSLRSTSPNSISPEKNPSWNSKRKTGKTVPER